MKKLVFLFLLTSTVFSSFSQKAIPYVPMYVPKSTDQMWNEIVMANTVVDKAIIDVKNNFTQVDIIMPSRTVIMLYIFPKTIYPQSTQKYIISSEGVIRSLAKQSKRRSTSKKRKDMGYLMIPRYSNDY